MVEEHAAALARDAAKHASGWRRGDGAPRLPLSSGAACAKPALCSCWSRCRSALLGRGFRCRLLSFTRSALSFPFGSAPLLARELRLAVRCAINWRRLCRNELRLWASRRLLLEILQAHDDSGKQLLGLAQLCLQRSNLR